MENQFSKLKLNHSEDALHKAFGLNFYRKQVICNTLLFEVIANKLLARELFDDISEAPNDMTTMTGILQKTTAHFDDMKELTFLLLIYMDMYAGLSQHANNILEGKKGKSGRDNVKVITNLDNKFDDDDEDSGEIKKLLGKLVDKLKSKFDPIKSAIKFIKECDYDYDRFIEKVCPKDKCDEIEKLDLDGGKGFNIDDIMGKLGLDDEDDD